MNTLAFNDGKRHEEQQRPAPPLDQYSAAERENYWRGRQAGEKK